MKKMFIIIFLVSSSILSTSLYATELTSMRVACNNKIAPACYQLALLYDKGQGLAKDSKKAKALYLEACNYGYEKACTRFETIKTED